MRRRYESSACWSCFLRHRKSIFHGCQCAAITHGHPTGYLAAGFLAAVISQIISGASLKQAISESIRILKIKNDYKETMNIVESAIFMADKNVPSPEVIQEIGAGWIVEEALAIGLYCSLVADKDFDKGVLLSVNHSGDSDSTGSITGTILGALYGIEGIYDAWIENLELKDVIEKTAQDLFNQFN